MVNYYEILGLSYGAGVAEVKASFRQLAKLYHPDKNPEGIEHFTKILKAYEVLSDPALKASYDYKLNYHQAQTQHQQQSKPNTKTWKFDEREMKRRQYYNEHIKKYAKETSRYMAEAETKRNYNEFKYILFATPLAVILFLLIMNLATRDKEEVLLNTEAKAPPVARTKEAEPAVPVPVLKPGDAPYNALFGSPQYEEENGRTLRVRNESGEEVIVCLFRRAQFVRSIYLPDSISAELAMLPRQALDIYYYSGRQFSASIIMKDTGAPGGFMESLAFYRTSKAKKLNSLTELVLGPGTNKGFEQISETDFFKYAKKQL